MIADSEHRDEGNDEVCRLRRELAEARAILQQCAMPLAVFEGDRLRWANPRFRELLGIPDDAGPGTEPTVAHLVAAEPEAWAVRLARVASTAVPEEGRLRLPDASSPEGDGWTYRLTAMPGGGGEVLCQLAPARTARPTDEPAVRASEPMYRSLLESSPCAVLVIDPEGRIQLANPLAQPAFPEGMDPVGQSIFQWVTPEDEPRARTQLQEVLREGILRDLELMLRRPSGEVTPYEINAAVVRDPSGQPRQIVVHGTNVTERRRAEETLRRREATLQSIFRAAPVGIGLVVDRTFQEINVAASQMLGYPPEEICGQSTRLVYPTSQDYDWMGPEIERQMKEQGRGGLETCLRRKDGSRVEVQLNWVPIDPDDFSRGFTFTALDITERKRSERALRQSEETYRSLVSATPIAVTVADPSGKILMVNQAAYELYGASPPVVGRSLFEWVPPEARERIQQELHNLVAGGVLRRAELTLQRSGGERFLAEVHGASVRDPQGAPSCVVLLSSNITERKQAEEALRESESRLRLALAAGRMGVWEWDLQSGVYSSAEGLALAGLSQFDGTRESARRLFHPDDLPRFLADVQRAIQERTHFTGEFRIVRPDGAIRWVSLFGQTEGDANARPRRFVGTALDISERKQAEEARLRLEAQLQHAQKLESLGVLAGGVAHDFNNILAAIRAYATLVQQDLAPATPAYQRVEEIQAAAQRAGELTRQILAYAGKGQLCPEPLDLSRIIEEMRGMLEVGASKKTVFRYQLADDLPATLADVSQIRQVVLNLVVNASEALGEASGVVSISTRTLAVTAEAPRSNGFGENLPEGSYVCLEVADTGCGMEREQLLRIFDPFFTTKFTGRGLGLATVQGIVRSHRGALHVWSQVGKGSLFQVLLPGCEAVTPPRPASPPPTQRRRSRGTVLVVDDERLVRETTKLLFQTAGFEVLTASDGEEAVATYRAHAAQIICVVLDLTMPKMSGEEVYHALSALNPQLRVILTSGYSEKDLRKRFASQPIFGFVEKPDPIEGLIAKLQAVLAAEGP